LTPPSCSLLVKPSYINMISYDFSAIRPQTTSVLYYGSLAGFVLGYYITLAKTPYFVFLDSFYGAFLGFVFTSAFCLLAQYISFEPKEDLEMRQILTVKVLYLFLQVAKRTSNKKLELFCLSALREMGIIEGPISSRTRAKTRQ
jgi:hypothetical protein